MTFDVDKNRAMFVSRARELFEKDGVHPPIAFFVDEENFALHFIPQEVIVSLSKDDLDANLKLYAQRISAVFYVFITESWAVKRPHPFVLTGPVSAQPDRQECLTLTMEDVNKRSTHVAFIHRDGDRVTLGPWIETVMEGRFTRVLPQHDGSKN
jgi:hypothetical protein